MAKSELERTVQQSLIDRLIDTVRPLLERFRDERDEDERFGDFWTRIGLEPIPVPSRAIA